jgi:uncharacterized protein (TIGR03000 family)
VVIGEVEKGKAKEKEMKEEKRKKEKKLQAKLLVELPADAKLFIDGQEMKSGISQRGIITPPLDPRQTYSYQVKAVLVRSGHTMSETRRIRLIPGELVSASFANLENRAAAIVQAEKR